MAKAPPPELVERSPMAIAASSKVAHDHHHQRPSSTNSMSSSFFSPKLSIYILSACVALFVVFHIQSLQTPPDSTSSLPSWSLNNIMQRVVNNTTTTAEEENNYTDTLNSLRDRLRQSVTFLPLKDLRYAHAALVGHTWFMSSMYDSSDQEGEVQYQHFPSHSSSNRLLCLKGRDSHDGSWNSYALAWPDALPHNATLMAGLSFISYNHYDYDNIWHGLSALMPFVAWHKKHSCANSPERWILYHWGEIRSGMALWLTSLMEATFGGPPLVEVFDGVEEGTAVCFEKAVVMRHNEGGMSRDQRMEVYDLMRCKARAYCKVISSDRRSREIGMTLFMRTGPRSFQNESAVVGIFEKECAKVHGCRLMVAHSNNLTFCDQVRMPYYHGIEDSVFSIWASLLHDPSLYMIDQALIYCRRCDKVKLMSRTDILISPHGAQLTNMFLMDRNSSVMEFFPKGWLKLAGVGQFVYHWIASWSGMRHQGAWRDPNGEICQYSEDDRRCMSLYKNGKIGINETYFSEWGRITLNQVKRRNMEEAGKGVNFTGCICG